MKIGINGYEAVIPRFGYDSNGFPNRVGSSEVCFEWLKELEKVDKKNQYVIYLPAEPTNDLPKEREGWQYIVLPNKSFWTIFALSFAIRKQKFDIFFSPTHYSPLFTPCPQVISILDLSYKHFPKLFKKKDLFQLNLWGGYSVRSAQKVITISQSSKDDIIKEYHIDPGKISVVYPGLKFEVRDSKSETPKSFSNSRGQANTKLRMSNWKQLKEKYNLDSPYILFVGTLQPRKNIVRLVEAYSKLKIKNLKLVIIGRRGWNYEEILEAPRKYGVSDHVQFLENVPNEELPAFYKNAQCFILPSLYEGFGLPILEAFEYGCPVLTSNVSSLPEAGGNAAIYFNPEDVLDITNKINRVLSDKKLRADMIKKGYKQVKKFSWERSAREVLNVLETVGSRPG